MQPPTDQPPSDSDRVKSINESAKHVATLTITFLAACVYVGVAAASTTHEMLLMGRDFTLPLFDAEVSLKPFYWIAPLFVIILHLHLLLQDYILVTKLASSPWAQDGLATYFFPELTVSRILGWAYRWPAPFLLKVIRWVIYVVLPVSILLGMQGQFLAYHSKYTTRWHQALVTIDLALILIFRWRIAAEKHQKTMGKGRLGWPHSLSWMILVAAVIAALLFSWVVAAVPYPEDPGKLAAKWPFAWPRRNLVLREHVLIGGEPSAELLALYTQQGLTLDEVYRTHAKGVSLNGRNLTGADFTGARLINADFRGADLRKARFVSAVLQGARFEPAGGADGRFEGLPGDQKRLLIAHARGNKRLYPPTVLEGADFTDADLEGACLILAMAARATLIRADLRGVELTYADLREARMRKAKLAGADLWHSLLQGADLTNADLRAADLSFSEPEGAVLELARLTAANLSNAKLAGAWFAGANLRGADFGGALATGASFRQAFLESSRGLRLLGISLRQAHLDALCWNFDLPAPSLVDLREVELPVPDQEGRVWSASALEEVPEGPLRNAALRRLKSRPIRPFCKGDEMPIPPASLRHLGLLYHDERRPDLLKDWPPVADQAIPAGAGWAEDDFYSELAALWAEQSCSSEGTARALVRLATKPPSLAEKELLTALKRQLVRRFEDARRYEAALEQGLTGIGRPCPVLLGMPEEIGRMGGSRP